MLHTIASVIDEGKEELVQFDKDSTLVDISYKQGAIYGYMKVLSWYPEEHIVDD